MAETLTNTAIIVAAAILLTFAFYICLFVSQAALILLRALGRLLVEYLHG